jgi:hypothetical protein
MMSWPADEQQDRQQNRSFNRRILRELPAVRALTLQCERNAFGLDDGGVNEAKLGERLDNARIHS